jgi:hypothetical protein
LEDEKIKFEFGDLASRAWIVTRRAALEVPATFPYTTANDELVANMADDFVRLVSQANPALRQYQPAGNGYPPSSSSYHDHNQSTQLDPFFDDEDDVPDSAFGRPAAMMSKESGLPLAQSAAAPAGHGAVAPDGDILQDWDDVPAAQPNSFPGSTSFPGKANQSKSVAKERASYQLNKWRWPWKKEEEELAGERIIALNNVGANAGYRSNYVSTTKYNVLTFVPKFLFGMFHYARYHALLTILCRAILKVCQSIFLIHSLHTTNPWSFPHQPLHYHCTPKLRIARLRNQRISGGSGKSSHSPYFDRLQVIKSHRNDINPIPS